MRQRGHARRDREREGFERPRHAGSRSRVEPRGGGKAPGGDAHRILELQRLAGNRAVADAIGSWRSGRVVTGVAHSHLDLHPSAPPDGLKKIRTKKNGQGILGLTVRSIEPSPPLLRPETPVKNDKGWTTMPRSVRVPAPYFEVYWPTEGRHALSDAITLDVTGEWDKKLKQGEDEHVDDTTLGWKVTWGKVGETINTMAREPGSPQPTEEAARADLWTRFVRALPADLRPAGKEPTDDAQTSVWGFEPTTTIFRRLFDATVARDTRNWHRPDTTVEFEEKTERRSLTEGDSKIGTVKPAELIEEFRKKASSKKS